MQIYKTRYEKSYCGFKLLILILIKEKETMVAEKIVYQACPSQIRNFLPFLGALAMIAAIFAGAILFGNNILLVLLLLPAAYAGWKWLEIKTTTLTITDQRIITSHGVVNKTTNETELYRVRDTRVEEPWNFRLFGLGSIIVYTTDDDRPTHSFTGYARPHWLKDQIRNNAEICRQKKRWGADSILLHEGMNQ